MNWAYLAGFTDGDGCISRELSKGKYAYARLRWAQKLADAEVLDEIAEFLRSKGLKVGLRNFSVAYKGHKYPQASLEITNAEDTRLALHEMLPYLVVKRDRAIEALALLDGIAKYKAIHGQKYREVMEENARREREWLALDLQLEEHGELERIDAELAARAKVRVQSETPKGTRTP